MNLSMEAGRNKRRGGTEHMERNGSGRTEREKNTEHMSE